MLQGWKMRYMYARIMHKLRIAYARYTGHAINRFPTVATFNIIFVIQKTLKMGIYANTPDTEYSWLLHCFNPSLVTPRSDEAPSRHSMSLTRKRSQFNIFHLLNSHTSDGLCLQDPGNLGTIDHRPRDNWACRSAQ